MIIKMRRFNKKIPNYYALKLKNMLKKDWPLPKELTEDQISHHIRSVRTNGKQVIIELNQTPYGAFVNPVFISTRCSEEEADYVESTVLLAKDVRFL